MPCAFVRVKTGGNRRGFKAHGCKNLLNATNEPKPCFQYVNPGNPKPDEPNKPRTPPKA